MTTRSALFHTVANSSSRPFLKNIRKLQKLQKPVSSPKSHIQIIRFFAFTTPGKYLMCMLVVISCLLISIIALSYTISAKRTTYERILDHSINLNTTARVLYTSLSNLDEQIVNLSMNNHPDLHLISQLRYDLTEVTRATIYMAENSNTNDQRYIQDLKIINTHLPDYIQQLDSFIEPSNQTADAERAWARNAHISDTYLLPAAKDLLTKNIQELIKESSQATNIPFFLIFLIILALISLLLTYWLFASKSGRRANLGLVIALILTFLQFVWIFGAGFAGSIFGNQARDLGISDLSHQTSILIHAEQARRDELLKVSILQHGYTYDQNFFLNLEHINQDILQYSAHTSTGTRFLVNVNHLIYSWSHLAAAISGFNSQYALGNSRKAYLDAHGHNPLTLQSLTEVILTSQLWETLKSEINTTLESTTLSYSLAAQESFEIWRDAVLVTFIFGGISLITASLGIIIRLRDFKR